MNERNALRKLQGHRGIVGFGGNFQDQDHLYFALEYCPNGTLQNLIDFYKDEFPIEAAKTYVAQIVSILEHLQNNMIVHRDLKPDNLLLDKDFNLKLADFGTAKNLQENLDDIDRKETFVGTADYVSPEMLQDLATDFGADLWSLGCIVHQLFTGKAPFVGANDFQVFQSIQTCQIDYPEHILPEARDLIGRLLVLNPQNRLGSGNGRNSMQALKNHELLQYYNPDLIYNYAPTGLILPDLSSPANSQDLDIDIEYLNRTQTPDVIFSGLIRKRGW